MDLRNFPLTADAQRAAQLSRPEYLLPKGNYFFGGGVFFFVP